MISRTVVAVAARQRAVAVELDLVQPVVAGGRLGDRARELRRDPGGQRRLRPRRAARPGRSRAGAAGAAAARPAPRCGGRTSRSPGRAARMSSAGSAAWSRSLKSSQLRFALARLRLQPGQHPAAVELLAGEAELEGALREVVRRRRPSAPRRRCPRRSSARRRTRPRGSRPRSRCTRADGPRSRPPAASRPGRATAPSAPPSSSARRRARAAGRSGRRWRGACARRSGCRRPPPRPPAGSLVRAKSRFAR